MLIVVAQLVLKLFDRYYLPYFPLWAGDEIFWLTSLAIYSIVESTIKLAGMTPIARF